MIWSRWFRRANHAHGEEWCDIYVRHWHVGPFIVWSR